MSKLSLQPSKETDLVADRISSSARFSFSTKAPTPVKRPFTGTTSTKTKSEIRRLSIGSDRLLYGLSSRRSSLISKSQTSLLAKEESRKLSIPQEEQAAINVAVRVRPFVAFRSVVDEDFHVALCCVQMQDNYVQVSDPESSQSIPQRFDIERCYWSHDGFVRLNNGYLSGDNDHVRGKQYATQGVIHIQIGQDIVKRLWGGYNSTVIAYGESGSGKSFSLFGTAENKGLALRIYDDLFYQLEKRRITDKNLLWAEVTFRAFEVFEEQIIDLLVDNPKGLKIYTFPNGEYFLPALSAFSIATYKELTAVIERALVNRANHATNYRRETKHGTVVFQITLEQHGKFGNKETCKSGTVTVIEAASSEAAFSSYNTNDQWTLAAKQLNESLLALEGCLKAMADPVNSEPPYEDSVLTKLLQNALGKNSYVQLLVTISPEDTSYPATLKTLQLAEIVKNGTVKVKPTEVLVQDVQKELKLEIERLRKKQEALQKEERSDEVKKALDETRVLIKEFEKQLSKSKEPLNDRMQTTELFIQSITHTFGEEEDKKKLPHLSNLTPDSMTTDRILHFVFNGDVTIGSDKENTVALVGPGIEAVHAVLSRSASGNIQIEPVSRTAKLLINGRTVRERTELRNNDRILFGCRHAYVYRNPKDEHRVHFQDEKPISFWTAFEEIIHINGIAFSTDNTLEAGVLNWNILRVIPQIGEANVMAEELNKDVKYDVQLITPEMQGRIEGQTEMFVAVFHTKSNQRFEWSLQTFESRLFAMRELYRRFEKGEDIGDIPEVADPFFENPEADVRIGTARLYLQPLTYMVRVKENLDIVNFKGEPVGIIETELVPCNDYGDEYTEDDNVFIDNPSELIDSNLSFMVRINCCKNLPRGYTAIYCCYTVYQMDEKIMTERISGTTDPEFGHEKFFSFRPATRELLAHFADSYVALHVMARQATAELAVIRADKDQVTRQKMQNDLMEQTNALMEGFRINGREVDPTKQSVIVELLLMKKQQARQSQKIENLRRLVQSAEQHHQKRVPTSVIRDLLLVSSAEGAEEVLSKLDVYESELSKTSSLCVLQ